MKKFIIFLLFMPQLFYGQWVQQVSGTTENLNDIFCVTEDLVFAVGDNGTILKTTDGGTTWLQKTSGTNNHLKKIQFANNNYGFISSYNGSLFRTNDSGNNWTITNALNVLDFSVINGDIIFYTNTAGVLYKSINGGITFEIINSTQNLKKIKFINQLIGYETFEMIGIVSEIRKTTNGGVSWDILNNNVISFSFLNDNIGFISTLNGIYKTVDGGLNFVLIDSNFNGNSNNKLYAVSENIVWGIPLGLLLNGIPIYSVRGEIINSNSFQMNLCRPFTSINFANTNLGYAVSDNKIFKNSTGQLRVKELSKKEGVQIYPNPATNCISLSLSNLSANFINIEIIDLLGKNIFSEVYNSTNNITIDSQNFPKGIYILSVTTGDNKQTEKLIIN